MPRPVDPRSHYLPGLDGIRAIAVIAVFGYHLGFSGFGGGLLGVGVFFTLSGYLITRILLTSWSRTGTLQLRRFWVHRFRRLVPALLVVLVVTLTATALVDPARLGQRWGQSLAAGLYVANWHTIGVEQSYFERFAGPGPLDHLWSLSVEEQFYLAWPLVMVIVLGWLGLRRRWLVAMTACACLASFVVLAVLASPGIDNTRAYEGTDTRAGGILLGALLALAWETLTAVRRHRRILNGVVQGAGLVALGSICWLVAQTDDYSMSLYTGGLLLLSVASMVLVAAVAWPGSLLNRVLGVGPLRYLGERSYGLYLWQLPVIAAMSTQALATHRVWWSVLLVTLTVMLAEASWRLVENPIRTHGLRVSAANGLRQVHGLISRRPVVTWRRPGLVVGAAGLTLAGVLALVSVNQADPVTPVDEASLASFGATSQPPTEPPAADHVDGFGHRIVRPGPTIRRVGVGLHRNDQSRRAQTSCTSVAYVGESTSLGLVSSAYLPERSTRIAPQLHSVGVRRVRTDILGARSIVEKWHDQPNAQDAVDRLLADGFAGCWVVAMGTNDSANRAVGGVATVPERINLIMDRLADQPVLWLTVKSLRGSGPYANAAMAGFDDALRAACGRYPTLRLFDWAGEVQDQWFIADGIHFTSRGYAERAHRIADALANAFGLHQPAATTCSVGS